MIILLLIPDKIYVKEFLKRTIYKKVVYTFSQVYYCTSNLHLFKPMDILNKLLLFYSSNQDLGALP